MPNLKKDFIDYWDNVVRQWLDNGADISKFGGDAAEQREVINAINGTVVKKPDSDYQLQTKHIPEAYWGNPEKCSIVIVNYNPAGGPTPNRHSTINCKNCTSFSEMTLIKFVDKYKYSDLACTPVMFEPVVGKAWFSDPAKGFVGYDWWQKKIGWIDHLITSICGDMKREKRSPFSMELCAWHSKKWSNDLSWLEGNVKNIIDKRFVHPLYLALQNSLWNSNVKIAVCIGSLFNFDMLEKFFGKDNIMDISQHISNNISVSGYTVGFKGGNIHVETEIENNGKKQKKNRNYRVFMLSDSGNRYYILNTHYRGGNSHPAKHFWDFEEELIKEIKNYQNNLIMLTINSIRKRLPYTYKEIVEFYYPEIWDLAQRCLKISEAWQEMSVELMPPLKRRSLLLDYLKVRSLYRFAHYIGKQVNRFCHELASCENEQDDDGVDNAKIKLAELFENLGKVDALAIAKDNTDGFHKLEQAIEGFGITVLHVMPNWSFKDIAGNLKNGESSYDSLWAVAINSPDPTKPDIDGLMESEEDNKPVRMY